MTERNFFAELKRRHVYKVGAAYVVAGWLLIQVVTQVFPIFEVPALAQRAIVLLIVAGLPIALLLSWVFDITPGGIVRTENSTAEQFPAANPKRLARDRRLNYLLAALLVAAVAYFFIERAINRRVELNPGDLAKSLAVLPLVNTSGDPANEYFSDGLSEELIAVLAKIPQLKVIGRSSSFLFKGKATDTRAIGQTLGVANLVEGSVRKQGEQVRIVAELVSAADGHELWSETYDRELKDVFAVQSEIAVAVAEQMKIKLLGQDARSDAMPSNQNVAAYNAVLQSDFYFRQQTAASIRQAISYAEEALKIDPKYALAWAKLSQAWRQYAATFSTDDTQKAYSEARIAADKAISLAPNLVDARTAVGWICMNPNLNFQAAEKEFRRAVELAPGDALAKNALGYALMAQGRIDEAERICQEARLLDPLYLGIWYNLGRLALGAGQYQEARKIFEKALQIQPNAARLYTYLATLEILEKNPAAALEQARLEPEGFWHDYATTLALQTGNDRAAADTSVRNFTDKNPTNAAFQVAVLHAVRHEPDEMFKWLENACTTRDSGLTQISITPFILAYRQDPRLVALAQKFNIQLPSESR